MQLTEEESRQLEESSALDLSSASQISIKNLKQISFTSSPIPIPPTITISSDWYGTPCRISPIRARMTCGIKIICPEINVKTVLHTFTLCTIPACEGDLYKNPEFDLEGKETLWEMETLPKGFTINFVTGLPPRRVAVILSDFPAAIHTRAGVCTWTAT